jgi:hypothetical protein
MLTSAKAGTFAAGDGAAVTVCRVLSDTFGGIPDNTPVKVLPLVPVTGVW